ncbi:MAG: hypothetical protein U0163_04550 [Gemmatimonadaceae bacterium]
MAYYDRALARAAVGARDSAAADFRRYIARTPGGNDHAAIERAMTALPPHVYAPRAAFSTGLVFPGLGQVRTGRPLLGGVALGAFAGAMTLALQWRREYQPVVRRDGTGALVADSALVTTHPGATVGYPLAAAVWLLSAAEAAVFARRTHTASESIVGAESALGANISAQLLPNGRAGLSFALVVR